MEQNKQTNNVIPILISQLGLLQISQATGRSKGNLKHFLHF